MGIAPKPRPPRRRRRRRPCTSWTRDREAAPRGVRRRRRRPASRAACSAPSSIAAWSARGSRESLRGARLRYKVLVVTRTESRAARAARWWSSSSGQRMTALRADTASRSAVRPRSGDSASCEASPATPSTSERSLRAEPGPSGVHRGAATTIGSGGGARRALRAWLMWANAHRAVNHEVDSGTDPQAINHSVWNYYMRPRALGGRAGRGAGHGYWGCTYMACRSRSRLQ